MMFQVEENAIRFGMLAIKNVGAGGIDAIVKERGQNGPYKGFYDFLTA
jgi:DNA polymerase-3 subunit alpha